MLYPYGAKKPTQLEIHIALNSGWSFRKLELGNLKFLCLPGDKSYSWCTQWFEITWGDEIVRVPGYLRKRLEELGHIHPKFTPDTNEDCISKAWEPLLALLRKAEPNFKVRDRLVSKFWEMLRKHYGSEIAEKAEVQKEAAESCRFQTQSFIVTPS